jgi:hypothetical protein
MTRHYCCCCGRQMVQLPFDKKITTSSKCAVSMGFGQWCCPECAVDLDENGLFPEERSFLDY